MEYVKIKCADGVTRKEKIYNVDDFPYFEVLTKTNVIRAKKNGCIIAKPATFDIETTNIKSGERPFAFMYLWQFCIEHYVVFGRRWEEFLLFMDRLRNELFISECRKLVVYVHNLSFEFQFLQSFLQIEKSFCLDKHRIVKFETFDGSMEFRDSYILSNMTLQKFCENSEGVKYSKLDGGIFDYSKIRTPETELLNYEKAYAYCDVRGLLECLECKLKEDTLLTIPMTSTGYVRRDFRNSMKQNPKNREMFLNTRLNSEQFNLLHDAFRGGDTHANLIHVNQDLKKIYSRDISSSYPFQMMVRKYPMGKFTKVSFKWFMKHQKMLDDYAFCCRIYLKNFRYIGNTGNPYIPVSKLKMRENIVNDNGRALSGSGMIAVTDIDFKIIINEYEYEEMKISDIYISKYGYLPDEFKSVLMGYFGKKTKLKGVDGFEYEYGKSKNSLNAGYGMTVTNPTKETIEYLIMDGEGIYKPEVINTDDLTQFLLDEFYKKRSSFLPYQWGVWVTCHARKQLRDMMIKLGDDYVYCDTDSLKFYDRKNDLLFEDVNKSLEKLAKDFGAFAEDRKGKIVYMGLWDSEGYYQKFKTLGAKKYVVKKKGKIETTIAGVSKKCGRKHFEKRGMQNFKVGEVINESGHLVAYYNDEIKPHYINIDGCKILTGANVALLDGSYTIGVTAEYLDLFERALRNEEYILL